MLRFLWVAVLLVSVGADKVDPWKQNMKVYFDGLTRDLNAALRKSLDYPIEPQSTVTSDGSYVESLTSTSSSPQTQSTSTSYPVVHTPSEKTDDCDPCSSYESTVQKDSMQVGSIRGLPGVNFPDYIDIPLTSFACSNKDYIPGFYADLETGCQVFHVCWPHRRESFLCPVGTTFNQALLACDYWYSSNCSQAPHYYNVNSHPIQQSDKDSNETSTSSMISVLLGAEQESATEQSKDAFSQSVFSNPDAAMSFISKFLPVQAKVTVYPETADSPSKIVATASVGTTKQREQYHKQRHYNTAQKQSQHTSTDKTVPESKHSDQSPETSDKKYANIEDSVIVILEEVSKTVRSIIQEARDILAARHDHTASRREKARPLTKLNPRFITKPVTLPKDDVKRPPTFSSTKTVKVSGSTNYSVDSKAGVSKSLPDTQLSISAVTKKALTKNYLRLLKIRKT